MSSESQYLHAQAETSGPSSYSGKKFLNRYQHPADWEQNQEPEIRGTSTDGRNNFPNHGLPADREQGQEPVQHVNARAGTLNAHLFSWKVTACLGVFSLLLGVALILLDVFYGIHTLVDPAAIFILGICVLVLVANVKTLYAHILTPYDFVLFVAPGSWLHSPTFHFSTYATLALTVFSWLLSTAVLALYQADKSAGFASVSSSENISISINSIGGCVDKVSTFVSCVMISNDLFVNLSKSTFTSNDYQFARVTDSPLTPDSVGKWNSTGFVPKWPNYEDLANPDSSKTIWKHKVGTTKRNLVVNKLTGVFYNLNCNYTLPAAPNWSVPTGNSTFFNYVNSQWVTMGAVSSTSTDNKTLYYNIDLYHNLTNSAIDCIITFNSKKSDVTFVKTNNSTSVLNEPAEFYPLDSANINVPLIPFDFINVLNGSSNFNNFQFTIANTLNFYVSPEITFENGPEAFRRIAHNFAQTISFRIAASNYGNSTITYIP
ncbi:hypothetical protein HK096_005470, partial [Nowakowskiella sp. JEL0078]